MDKSRIVLLITLLIFICAMEKMVDDDQLLAVATLWSCICICTRFIHIGLNLVVKSFFHRQRTDTDKKVKDTAPMNNC